MDNDCPLDKACQNKECRNPCLTTNCGTRAICEVDFHTSVCVCPPGLQGNPLVACFEAGCSSDNECATDQKCDYAPGSSYTRKECTPLCNPGNCAIGADCIAQNHRETCRCRPPLTGDGIVSCVERKLTLENFCVKYLTQMRFVFLSLSCYCRRSGMSSRCWLLFGSCMYPRPLPESLPFEQSM